MKHDSIKQKCKDTRPRGRNGNTLEGDEMRAPNSGKKWNDFLKNHRVKEEANQSRKGPLKGTEDR